MQISAVNSLYRTFMKNASAQGIEPRKEVTVSAASEEAYQLDLSPQAQKMLAPKDTTAAAAEAKPTRRRRNRKCRWSAGRYRQAWCFRFPADRFAVSWKC